MLLSNIVNVGSPNPPPAPPFPEGVIGPVNLCLYYFKRLEYGSFLQTEVSGKISY